MPIPGTLDHAFMSVGGRETAIAMTRLASHKDPALAEFIRNYDELSIADREQPGLLEQLCLVCGLHPSDYFGRICGVAYRYNMDVATFTAAVASRVVLERAAEFALQKDGFKDRELILKSSKMLESSPLVKIDNTQNTINQVAPNLPQLSGKVSEIIRQDFIEGEIVEPSPSLTNGDSSTVGQPRLLTPQQGEAVDVQSDHNTESDPNNPEGSGSNSDSILARAD